MVMEYCSGGDLFSYLEKGNRFTEGLARAVFQMFLETLECVHQQGLFHGDLKLENTMVGEDGRIRIIDFGFAEISDPSKPNTVKKGTPLYMAPEVKDGKYNGKQADLFALGVLLFVMACRRYPYDMTDQEKKKYVVLPDQYKFFLFKKQEYWKSVDKFLANTPHKEAFKNLIDKMLAQKPEERLTIDQVREHQWYRSVEPLSNAEVKEALRLRKEGMSHKAVVTARHKQQPAKGT